MTVTCTLRTGRSITASLITAAQGQWFATQAPQGTMMVAVRYGAPACDNDTCGVAWQQQQQCNDKKNSGAGASLVRLLFLSMATLCLLSRAPAASGEIFPYDDMELKVRKEKERIRRVL